MLFPIRSSRQFVALGLFLALSVAGCRGCSSKNEAPLLSLVPADSTALLYIPDGRVWADQLRSYGERLTKRAAGGLVNRFRQNLKRQMGFDPLVPEEMHKAGIDVDKGMVLFNEPGSVEPIVALAVHDPKTFEMGLKALVKRVDGADKLVEESAEGLTIQTLGRPFGDQVVPVLSWVSKKGRVLLVRGSAKDLLKKAAARLDTPAKPAQDAVSKPQSIAEEPVFKGLYSKNNKGQMFFFVRGSAAAMASGLSARMASDLKSDSLTSFAFDGAGAKTQTVISMAVPGLDKALQGPAPSTLLPTLDGNPLLVALTHAAKPDGIAALRKLPATAKALDRFFGPLSAQAGIDFEKDVLPTLKGGMSVAVNITSPERIPALVRSRAMGRILDVVNVGLVAPLADTAKMQALLKTSLVSLKERGLSLRERKAAFGEKEAWIVEPDRDRPLLGWAIWNDTYVYAVGVGQLDKSLMHLAAPQKTGAERAKTVGAKLLKGAAADSLNASGESVVILRGAVAADLVQAALKEEKGFGVAALAAPVVGLLRSLDDMVLSVRADSDGVIIKTRHDIK